MRCNFRKSLIKLGYFLLSNNNDGLLILNRLTFSKHVLRDTCSVSMYNGYRQVLELGHYPFYYNRFDDYNRILIKLKLLIVEEVPSIESYQIQKYKVRGKS